MKGRPRLRVAPCKFCNKEFKRQEHLERHIRTHTGERPFGCICGRTFSRPDLLNRHRRQSQCLGPGESPTEGTVNIVLESGAPCTAVSQLRHTDAAAVPPEFPNSSHKDETSVTHASNPTEDPLLEGTDSEGIPQTSTIQYEIIQNPTTINGRLSMELAPNHDRGETPVESLDIGSQDQASSQFSHDTAAGICPDIDMDTAIEPDRLFDIDFLAHETDMINGYLMDFLPSMEHKRSLIEDGSDSYSGIQSFSAGPEFSSSNIPANAQTERVILLAEATSPFQSTATHTHQAQNTIGRSLDAIDKIVATNPWTVSAAAYDSIVAEVANHAAVLPEPFILPNRQTLSRYVASWMRSFHPHLPFIHIPTTSLEAKTPMLVLTLAATGSFYGFEHSHGYPMFLIAKSIITQELEKRRRASTLHLLRTFPHYARLPADLRVSATRSSITPQCKASDAVDIELLQSLLVLILAGSWLDEPLAHDALAMSSQLAQLTREALECSVTDVTSEDWKAWACEEERRRTLFAAYFVMNILTICFNLPPQIFVSEISLSLPSSEAEFKAPTSTAWLEQRQKSLCQNPDFQYCLQQLLSGRPLGRKESASEFGNYMLVQSLLIQVCSERQVASNVHALCSSSPSLPLATVSLYENAYNAWQACWDSAIESALDPSSPHGPLAFNATAVLRLAHIHLAVGLQGKCTLRSRDPRLIAAVFDPRQHPMPLQSPHIDQAVFHAICALRIPVRVGIAFVARGRTGHWSVQHAISNFACALLLTHWLERLFLLVSANGLESVRPEDKQLLAILDRLVEETHLAAYLGSQDDYPGRIRRLAVAALQLWAETCKGIQVFDIVHVVGETLSLVAASLQSS